MKVSEFTATELKAIEAEAQDCGFPNAESFLEIEAGVYRLGMLSNADAFEKAIPDDDERQAFAEKIEPAAAALNFKEFRHSPESGDGWSYLLFPDGSLYLATNAQDEVWAEAKDFASEHLLNNDSLNRAERKLLRKLGGIYKDAVSDWKKEKRQASRRKYAAQAVLATPSGNVDASNTAFFWGAGANVGGFRFTNRPGLSKQQFIANAARWERINLKKTGGHIPAELKDDAALEAAEQLAEMAEMWAEEQREEVE